MRFGAVALVVGGFALAAMRELAGEVHTHDVGRGQLAAYVAHQHAGARRTPCMVVVHGGIGLGDPSVAASEGPVAPRGCAPWCRPRGDGRGGGWRSRGVAWGRFGRDVRPGDRDRGNARALDGRGALPSVPPKRRCPKTCSPGRCGTCGSSATHCWFGGAGWRSSWFLVRYAQSATLRPRCWSSGRRWGGGPSWQSLRAVGATPGPGGHGNRKFRNCHPLRNASSGAACGDGRPTVPKRRGRPKPWAASLSAMGCQPAPRISPLRWPSSVLRCWSPTRSWPGDLAGLGPGEVHLLGRVGADGVPPNVVPWRLATWPVQILDPDVRGWRPLPQAIWPDRPVDRPGLSRALADAPLRVDLVFRTSFDWTLREVVELCAVAREIHPGGLRCAIAPGG